ncbi:hypothetical protein QFC19_004229 [Naganishia cerealis]|uniref:Uncharacterized protein n=1 Tax=Naganishia cerealis TaxID=610337 RepID=A0ACC2VX47_9TREE|nr:hypothetical protein QFC19_004229 [Naganishia cerealis]
MNIPPLTEEVIAQQVAKIRAADVSRKVDVVQFFALQMEATSESTLTSLLPAYLHLLPSIPTDKPRTAVHQIMPPLLDKLNDAKERVHKPAEACLVDLGHAVYRKPLLANASLSSSTGSVAKGKEKENLEQMYERMLASALEAKGSRSKIGGMRVLCGVRQHTRGLGLKQFLPLLVGMLEDSDGSVREESKTTIIDLLSPSDVPASARSELQKLMQSRSLKSSLVDTIMNGILAGPQTRQGEDGNISAGKPATKGGETDVPPVHIMTERDLEKEFTNILPPFEGKETEHNWQAREAGIMRVRGMVQSGVHKQFPATFTACLRQDFWQESIKGLLTLRTTLSMATSALYAETAQVFGETFDPLMDTLLPHLTKLSGSTKKLVADASQKTVRTFIDYAACHPRTFLPFLASGLSERTVQSRQYFMEHIRHFLTTHTRRSSNTKNAIEQAITPMGPGLQVVVEMLKRGLQDANPVVKETARATFVVFHLEWPKHAQALLSGLDENARKQVEKAIQAAASAAGTPSARDSPLDQAPGAKVDGCPVTGAPGATVVPRRPGTGPARKPSSAIAAAIRKAKEEARTRQLAEASASAKAEVEAEAVTPADAVTAEEAPEEQEKREGEMQQKESPADVPNGETQETSDPAPDRDEEASHPPSSPLVASPSGTTPVPTSARGAASTDSASTPTTPSKPISLLDFSTPDAAAAPFKVMTPAYNKSVLLESTGINLLDPTRLALPASPEPALEKASSLADVEAVLPGAAIAPRSNDVRAPRKARVSVNPVRVMDKPAPLFSKLPTLVDCSFWLDRRQDYEQTENISRVPERLMELRHSPSDLVPQDVSGLIAWSNVHSCYELDGDKEETYNSDEGIRTHVTCEFQNKRELTDDEKDVDAHVESVLKIVDETVVNRTDDPTTSKLTLFLLWNLVIRQPRHIVAREDQIIGACFALRRSESLSIRRGSAGLLALIAETSEDPVRMVSSILLNAREALGQFDPSPQDGSSSDVRSRLEVFALVHVASVLHRLRRSVIAKEVVPQVKPLILNAIGSRAIASREAAYTTIVAVQSVVQDESALFTDLFPELGAAQRKLSTYMIQRDLSPAGEGGKEGTEGLMREVQRLSRRA